MKHFFLQRVVPSSLALILLLSGCAGSKYVPRDLEQFKTPAELGAASKSAYRRAKTATEKSEKLNQSHAGILYAERCLKKDPQQAICLYYQTLNTGIYIRNHILHYQRGLKKMVSNCETLIKVQPDFEHAGCYRILGNIYAQVPAFSLSSNGIIRDLERSVQYLREGARLAPDYALNHLFLARSLEDIGEKLEAKRELETFDRLRKPELDQEYAEWKKDRDALAKKLD